MPTSTPSTSLGSRGIETPSSERPGTESPRKARRAKMSGLGLALGRSFLHLFDFGVMVRHRVEIVEIGERDEEADHPRILDAHGEIESSHDIWSDPDLPVNDSEGLKALTGEIRLLLKLDSEEEEERARDPAAIRAQADLARRVREWGSREELGLEVLEEYCEFELEDWLLELVHDLVPLGQADEAADLAAGMAELLDEAEFLRARAFILVDAGRNDEARAQAEALLEKFPGNPQRMAEAGEVIEEIEEIGDVTRAESIYRRTLNKASGEWQRKEATLRLVPLLRRQGRHAEADRIEKEKPRRGEIGQGDLIPVRTSPKIGRNYPCPCGSGRKNKKCCGAAAN